MKIIPFNEPSPYSTTTMLNGPNAKELSAEPAPSLPLQQDQSTTEKQQPNPETIFAELKVNLDTAQTLRNDLEALQQAHAKQRTLAELRTNSKLGKDLEAAQLAYCLADKNLRKAQRAYDLGGGHKVSPWDVGCAFVLGLILGALYTIVSM